MNHSERIKVVRLITRLNIGGPARHVTLLSTRLGAEFDTTLLTGQPDDREGSLLHEAVTSGARIEHVPGLRREIAPLDDLRAFVWLYRYFRKVKPDIVATHTAKAGALGRLAAFLARVPIRVHTFHGHVLHGYFGTGLTSSLRAAERALTLFSTRIIAISPLIAADLIRMKIGRGRISVIRNGLELDGLMQAPTGKLRAELAVRPDQPIVGIVGRLVPIKAHSVFLEAVNLVRNSARDAEFVIIGDGELWSSLHRRVDELGLDRVVHFTGWRHDLAEIYGDLDVVVCCSANEGTPVSVIEAGAAGRPVVGTRVGGMPDVVQDGVNGLLVASGDAGALASALSRVLADRPMASRMGETGRRLAFAHYNADRMLADTRNLYRRLLERAERYS